MRPTMRPTMVSDLQVLMMGIVRTSLFANLLTRLLVLTAPHHETDQDSNEAPDSPAKRLTHQGRVLYALEAKVFLPTIPLLVLQNEQVCPHQHARLLLERHCLCGCHDWKVPKLLWLNRKRQWMDGWMDAASEHRVHVLGLALR